VFLNKYLQDFEKTSLDNVDIHEQEAKNNFHLKRLEMR
jgi:hypothetical protein